MKTTPPEPDHGNAALQALIEQAQGLDPNPALAAIWACERAGIEAVGVIAPLVCEALE